MRSSLEIELLTDDSIGVGVAGEVFKEVFQTVSLAHPYVIFFT